MNTFLILIVFYYNNSEILVNDDTIGGCYQQYSSVILNGKDNFFITWEDHRSTDYDIDIYCQKYDKNSNPIGSNFKVNDNLGGTSLQHWKQCRPIIATSDSQSFVIVWEDWRNGEPDIFYQLYDKNGNTQKINYKVNDDTNNKQQFFPSIAMSSGGKFIIVWEDWRNSDADIYAQLYDSTGNPCGNNFKANDNASNRQLFPSVATTASDNFIIVWEDYRSGNANIYGQNYNNGNPIGNNFKINTDTVGYNGKPCISMVNNNKFIVVWENNQIDSTICAQLYNLSGTPYDSNFTISSNGKSPYVTGNNSGHFIVVWEDSRTNKFISYKVYDSLGVSQTSDLTVTSGFETNTPRITLNNSGRFIITWIDNRENNPDVYYQEFTLLNNIISPQSKVNDDKASSYQDFPAIAIDGTGNFVVVWPDYRNGTVTPYNDPDIYGQKYNANGDPVGPNFRINDDGTSNFQWIPIVSMNYTGMFVVAWEDNRSGVKDIYAQLYDTQGQSVGKNFRVNTDSTTTKNAPYISLNNSGKFIITWENSANIYSQLYDSLGNSIGGNFNISSNRKSNKNLPAVAIYDSGGFIITWVDNGIDVYAQLYNKEGIPIGNNFKINNDFTGGERSYTSIAIDNGKYSYSQGNFIVVWIDKRNDNWDIYAQICDTSGSFIGTNFKVNDDNTSREQWCPSIAVDDSGKFIIVWTDFRDPNGDINVMAQCYKPDGTPIGNNVQIHNDMWWGNHQWAWKSVAISPKSIAFTWIDNRRLQGWDIYAKLTDWKNIAVETNTYSNSQQKFFICENPCRKRINIKSISYTNKNEPLEINNANINFELYDVTGKFCKKLFPDKKNSKYISFITSGLSSGIYFLKIEIPTTAKNKYVAKLKIIILN
ncbi:MAG: T9SS type A sorting domain-containing protein [bacterium]|nr:T9SS type A sorting domain-containing protein [bacterium]